MALVRITSRGRVFHGWYIVMVAFVTYVTVGIGNYAIGLFFKPMGDTLGWSRTAISWGVTIKSVLSMLLGPFLGPIVDRKHGALLLMVGGGALMGASLVLIAQVSQLWQFYLLFRCDIWSGSRCGGLGSGHSHHYLQVVCPQEGSGHSHRRHGNLGGWGHFRPGDGLRRPELWLA